MNIEDKIIDEIPPISSDIEVDKDAEKAPYFGTEKLIVDYVMLTSDIDKKVSAEDAKIIKAKLKKVVESAQSERWNNGVLCGVLFTIVALGTVTALYFASQVGKDRGGRIQDTSTQLDR